MKLSIKLRMTLLCTLLAALIASAAMAFQLIGEQGMLRDYYRNSLMATAQLARDDIRYEDGDLDIDRNLDDLPSAHVALFSLDGDLVYGRRLAELPFAEGEMRRTEGLTGDEWFLYDTMLSLEGGPDLWLRCGISADAAQGLLQGRSRLSLLALPGLVLLAGLGGYGIAWQVFRPVSRIVRTAEGIVDGADLKKRIALTGAKDELYALARTFDAMFERLDRAFERERQFTSDVSHELRTPVTSILTQSEFALSDAADDADRREALESIHGKAESMAGLIRRLLLLARMDAGQLRLERETVDLQMLAELAVASFEDAAAAKQMTLETAGGLPVEVSGDHAMLLQVVMNLVENAVRYGCEGGTVRLRAGRDGAQAWLSVEDDGPGIEAKDMERIFERFYQADPARHVGSGLGLSLAARIAQLHGGRVDVRSAPGAGSCFTLILPDTGGTP